MGTDCSSIVEREDRGGRKCGGSLCSILHGCSPKGPKMHENHEAADTGHKVFYPSRYAKSFDVTKLKLSEMKSPHLTLPK